MNGKDAPQPGHAAVLRCDAEGWITAVNARCAALFAAPAELLVGSALAGLFPNEAELRPRLRRSAAGDSVRLQAHRATGVAFYVEAEAVVDPRGEITCRLWDVLGAATGPVPAGVLAAAR